MNRSYGGATEEQITALEQEIGHRFPEDYRRFLKEIGGGELDDYDANCFFPEGMQEEDISVDTLFGIDPQKTTTTLQSWREEFGDFLPDGFVSIGTSIQDGDILLYVKDDENLNAVYYFDSSCTAEASTEEENTYFVCDSFAEFWEQLDRE